MDGYENSSALSSTALDWNVTSWLIHHVLSDGCRSWSVLVTPAATRHAIPSARAWLFSSPVLSSQPWRVTCCMYGQSSPMRVFCSPSA
eukprot:3933422-Rhodomonas_salina.1